MKTVMKTGKLICLMLVLVFLAALLWDGAAGVSWAGIGVGMIVVSSMVSCVLVGVVLAMMCRRMVRWSALGLCLLALLGVLGYSVWQDGLISLWLTFLQLFIACDITLIGLLVWWLYVGIRTRIAYWQMCAEIVENMAMRDPSFGAVWAILQWRMVYW